MTAEAKRLPKQSVLLGKTLTGMRLHPNKRSSMMKSHVSHGNYRTYTLNWLPWFATGAVCRSREAALCTPQSSSTTVGHQSVHTPGQYPELRMSASTSLPTTTRDQPISMHTSLELCTSSIHIRTMPRAVYSCLKFPQSHYHKRSILKDL